MAVFEVEIERLQTVFGVLYNKTVFAPTIAWLRFIFIAWEGLQKESFPYLEMIPRRLTRVSKGRFQQYLTSQVMNFAITSIDRIQFSVKQLFGSP